MATFVISGVWHGAAWTFVVWGALNGLGVLAVSLTQSNSKSNRQLHRRPEPVSQVFFPAWTDVLQILATFAFICVTWVFFRATSLEDAWLILTKTTVGLFETAGSRAILGQRAAITAAVVMVLLLVEWAQRHQPHPLVLDHWPRPIRWLTYSATLWTILLLRPSVQTGQFIYFQF
jgi:D-alanyl-lipoteichoic acid acyltransferase DltB (MBOAT superfamily)